MQPPSEALAEVLERVGRACARAGRDRAAVRLVAVSKTVPVERIAELAACGQRCFGENRVQEALDKMPRLSCELRWHLIGSLQRNKARHAVGRFELIHSVDGEPLARELDRRAAAAGLIQPVLIQLNLSGEPTKSGIPERDLPALVERVAALPHLRLDGLMTIPPPVDDPERSRPWFARLRELGSDAARRSGRPLTELSMGMTDDFEVAVEEGATLIRVGRALFGERG